MKEAAKSQVTIMQPSSGLNEQNNHLGSPPEVSLLVGALLVMALAVGGVLGLMKLWEHLNTREPVPPGGTDPTRPTPL